MPKIPKPRVARPETSTVQRRNRAICVEGEGLKMSFRCKRCEKQGLRCFVETTTGRCAGCISVAAECSLFVLEEEWKVVQRDCEEEELAVARLEAELAARKVALLEVKKRERSFARRDLAILAVQDRAQGTAGENTSPGTGLPVVGPSPSEPSADLSWLQADSYDPSSFVDPSLDLSSFDLSDFLVGPNLLPLDTVNRSPLLILCSL
jgi:hypothetical protein